MSSTDQLASPQALWALTTDPKHLPQALAEAVRRFSEAEKVALEAQDTASDAREAYERAEPAYHAAVRAAGTTGQPKPKVPNFIALRVDFEYKAGLAVKAKNDVRKAAKEVDRLAVEAAPDVYESLAAEAVALAQTVTDHAVALQNERAALNARLFSLGECATAAVFGEPSPVLDRNQLDLMQELLPRRDERAAVDPKTVEMFANEFRFAAGIPADIGAALEKITAEAGALHEKYKVISTAQAAALDVAKVRAAKAQAQPGTLWGF